MMRGFLRITASAIAGVIAFVAVVLAYGAWSYGREMVIDTPNGINESGYVRIGGVDQWIQIRGRDKRNPVLLWVNGGPGLSAIPNTPLYPQWEKYFTVVMWDQRGAGRTFEKYGTSLLPTMSIARMTQDGLEVTQYLRNRLHKDKIILLGHSWGSILATHMATQWPDLFYAYVGTGQVAHLRDDTAAAYAPLLARARSQGNQRAVRELTSVGPPPYAQTNTYFVPLKWANALDPQPQSLSLALVPRVPAGRWASVTQGRLIFVGAQSSQERMLGPMLDENLLSLAPRFKIPVIIIEGPGDLVTPGARTFFNKVVAPRKEFLLLPGTGHLAILRDPDGFLSLLLAHVRPLANADAPMIPARHTL
jgi:pimeloyl-ACP methyl ester carboxylesterase